jgi:hypothetical protein
MQRGLCTVVGLATLLLAGCSTSPDSTSDATAATQLTTGGTAAVQGLSTPLGGLPRWGYSTPAPPPPLATPDKIDAAIVDAGTVGSIVGSDLRSSQTEDKPQSPIELSAESECSVLLGLNSDSYGSKYTTYRSTRLQDRPDDPSHIVVQEVAMYPDARAAVKIFHNIFSDEVRSCNGATVQALDGDDRTDWQLQVGKIADARAQWRVMRFTDGEPTDWSCAHNTQYKNNVVLSAAVCQHDGGGVAAAAEITKRMASTVPAA